MKTIKVEIGSRRILNLSINVALGIDEKCKISKTEISDGILLEITFLNEDYFNQFCNQMNKKRTDGDFVIQ